MSSSSSLSRNKLTSLEGVKRSSVSSVLSGRTSKLRTELRRVMSDRVMKITRCSQQQTSVKSNANSSFNMNLSMQTKNKTIEMQHMQQQRSLIDKNEIISKETSPKFLAKMTGNTNTKNISPNAKLANKISLQPIKTFDLKDKKSLIDHIVTLYNDLVNSGGTGSIILTVQSIINSITHYIEVNQLDLKSNVESFLKENLFKSTIELKQKYTGDEEFSEKLKLEAQMQVMLQIENYIFSNGGGTGRVRVDDDWVWDIANSIRWIKQKFKDFKIERFLFGEIYANYSLNAAEFISSLMEELGYDKEDKNGDDNSSDSESSAAKSPLKNAHVTQLDLSADLGKPKITSVSGKFLSQLSQQNGGHQEESNCSFSVIGGVNSLFEDSEEIGTRGSENQFEGLNDEESCSQHPAEKIDVLDEFFSKKKTTNKGSSFSQTTVRSIVIQKKRTRLKIRSPFKSPSKTVVNCIKQSRRSPRIKDRQILSDIDGAGEKKRPRSYLITDTPDHKQNATIITTRQEKLRKRFSFQQFANSASSPSILPSVPDTPVKGETIEVATLGAGSLFPFQKLYPSPSKVYMSPQKYASPQKIYVTPQKIYVTPQKNLHVIHGSPLKVYATPSPKRGVPSSPSGNNLFASPQQRKSPAKRVVFK